MERQRPRLLVVDDDRAVLSLMGSGVTCFDLLRALRELRPQCEVVLMTGYSSLEDALDAVKRGMHESAAAADTSHAPSIPGRASEPATPLVEVEREHIIRTLEQVRGNKAVAARMLGISRRAFYRQLERHGLHQRVPMTRKDDAATAPIEQAIEQVAPRATETRQ
jgi:two-component system response regulator RegA